MDRVQIARLRGGGLHKFTNSVFRYLLEGRKWLISETFTSGRWWRLWAKFILNFHCFIQVKIGENVRQVRLRKDSR